MEKKDSKENYSKEGKKDDKDGKYESKKDAGKPEYPKPGYPKEKKLGKPQESHTTADPKMIEVIVNDRLGKKVRVKCCPDDTIGDLKKLIAAHTGTRPEKLRLQKWYNVYKDHITLKDYEINHGMGLELYYN